MKKRCCSDIREGREVFSLEAFFSHRIIIQETPLYDDVSFRLQTSHCGLLQVQQHIVSILMMGMPKSKDTILVLTCDIQSGVRSIGIFHLTGSIMTRSLEASLLNYMAPWILQYQCVHSILHTSSLAGKLSCKELFTRSLWVPLSSEDTPILETTSHAGTSDTAQRPKLR